MIEFLCPNGHRLHCPDDHANRVGKCPKCGVKFLIPLSSEPPQTNVTNADSSVSLAELSESGIGLSHSPGSAASIKEREIDFLCPNGHLLHCKATLQGHAGKCPQCGSKFRIPSYEEFTEETPVNEEIGMVKTDGKTDSRVGIDSWEVKETGGGASSLFSQAVKASSSVVGSNLTETTVSPTNSLGRTIATLWTEKPKDAILEIFLRSGEIIKPDQFAIKLSQQQHGVFAVKDTEETYTIVMIAWDAISHVQIRKLRELPAEFSNRN